jgi:hypothetical protein
LISKHQKQNGLIGTLVEKLVQAVDKWQKDWNGKCTNRLFNDLLVATGQDLLKRDKTNDPDGR